MTVELHTPHATAPPAARLAARLPPGDLVVPPAPPGARQPVLCRRPARGPRRAGRLPPPPRSRSG